jgi:hypothetical protein
MGSGCVLAYGVGSGQTKRTTPCFACRALAAEGDASQKRETERWCLGLIGLLHHEQFGGRLYIPLCLCWMRIILVYQKRGQGFASAIHPSMIGGRDDRSMRTNPIVLL